MKTGRIIVAAAALLFGLLFTLAAVGGFGRKERPGGGEPGGIRRGGILKIGTQAVAGLDPHFATTIADVQLSSQVYECLTYIDASNRPVPDLAESWDSPDGKTWTFALRRGAHFSNGRPVSAQDVVFSFNRLRDPKLGTPVVDLFRSIREVRALDPRRVQFLLAETNPEFASDVGDYHAAILPAGTADPAAEPIGSGPFRVDSWFPWQGAILKRNPYYDRKGADGLPLPYLQEIHLNYSPRLSDQEEALRRGRLDFIGGLTTETVKSLQRTGAARILTVDANMHWVIHLRSDPGHVAADNRVRRALKLATDHQEIVNAVRPGLASIGNGFTPVGPAFGMYHLVRPPFPDPARAKRLLAEAGYPQGLRIDLYVTNQPDVLPIAQIWKGQMDRIGVQVDIRVLSPEEYYGRGQRSWLKVDFGITDWGTRATPVAYFNLAYRSDAPWNETHWSDPEFDEVTGRLEREMDAGRRVRLYHQAQEILIERGPIIVVYFARAAAGVNPMLQGVTLASDWPQTRFREAWFARQAP